MTPFERVKELLEGAKPAPDVVTQSRAPVRSLTAVPDPINDWAKGNGMRLSWQMADDTRLTQIHALGIIPLRVQDLPKEVDEALENVKPFITGEGVFRRSNAVLCIQSQSNYDACMQAARNRAAAQRDGFDLMKFREEAAQLGFQAVVGEDWATSPSELIGQTGGSGYGT